jgi:pyridoxine 5'-phosphate synthase PdxJ
MRLLERDLPYHSVHNTTKYSPARTSDLEKISVIKAARISWENGINEELITIATEKQRPFATLQPEGLTEHPLVEEYLSLAARQEVRFLFDRSSS